MKKAKATIDFEVWNLDCPNCGTNHKFDRKEVEGEFIYCSECGEAFEPEMTGQEADLLAACKYVVQYHRENDSGEGELFGLDFVTTCINAIRKAGTNI